MSTEKTEVAAEQEAVIKPFEIALNNINHWLSCLSQFMVNGDKTALESAHLDLLANHEQLSMFYASPNTVNFNHEVYVPREGTQDIFNEIAVSNFVKERFTRSGQWLKAIALHNTPETNELAVLLYFVHRDGEPYLIREVLLNDTVDREFEPHVLQYCTGLEQHIDISAIPHNFNDDEAALITVRDHYDPAVFVQFYLTDENHPLESDVIDGHDHFRLRDMHRENQPSNRWIINQMSVSFTNRELGLLVAWGILYDYLPSGDLVEAEFTYGDQGFQVLFANGMVMDSSISISVS